MEKVLLHPYDKERMRLAMLKHEETFREQVNELHRLYRIQKMLMDNVGLSQQQHKDRGLIDESKKPFHMNAHQNYDHRQKQAQRNGDDQSKLVNTVVGMEERRDDQAAVLRSNAQERVAESNGGNTMMLDENEIELTLSLGPSAHNPRNKRTDKSESGQSLSSSSTGSSQTRRTSPNNKKGSSTKGDNPLTWSSSFPQGSENKPGFSNGQQTNPPWLLHALSLKLT